MFLIGDVHGRWTQYLALLEALQGETSVALGDVGFGFKDGELPTVPGAQELRGNHDNPTIARARANYLGDVGYRAPVFFISGGYSIDWMSRRPGLTWWKDEQLADTQMAGALALYKEVKPRFVISHDAPTSAAETLLTHVLAEQSDCSGYFGSKLQGVGLSRMSSWMERMLQAHQPERWVFAHFHTSRDFRVRCCDTQFTVLNELECREFSDIDFDSENSITINEYGTRVGEHVHAYIAGVPECFLCGIAS